MKNLFKTILEAIKDNQFYKKEKEYISFKANYFSSFALGLAFLVVIGSSAWVFKDIFMLHTRSTLAVITLRLFPTLLLSLFILFRNKKHLWWLITFIMIWVTAILNVFLNMLSNPVDGLSGEGWITYFVFFYTVSLISSVQYPIYLSYILLAILQVFTADMYGGPIHYSVNILRPVTTGLILAAGLSIASYVIRNAFLKLFKTQKTLEEISKTDMLTGIYNRHKLKDILQENDRLKSVSTIMIFDVDRFKLINDEYGHMGGDEAIKYCAKALKSICRDKSDLLFRFGGDEFLIVFEGQVDENLIYKRLQKYLKNKSNIYNVTFSIGSFRCVEDLNLYAAIKKADIAAYQSKNSGRNKLTKFEDMYEE